MSDKKEEKITKNTLWGLCIICWFATSYIQGTSDFTQIIINTIAPAHISNCTYLHYLKIYKEFFYNSFICIIIIDFSKYYFTQNLII